MIILLVLLSAYILFNEKTAHIKAGIQSIIVSCKIKQIIPEPILPCKISDNQGKKKAKTYLMINLIIVVEKIKIKQFLTP